MQGIGETGGNIQGVEKHRNKNADMKSMKKVHEHHKCKINVKKGQYQYRISTDVPHSL